MENLGIDIKLLVAQFVNFILFFVIFKVFIAKPFMTFLKKKEKEEEERLRLVEQAKSMQEVIEKKEAEARKHLALETDEAMKSAKSDAKSTREAIVAEAREEASAIIKKAHEQIEEDRRTMEKNMKNAVADLSVLIVSKALREHLSAKEQKALNEKILKNLETGLSV